MVKGIKAKDIRDFEKCVNKLNEIIERINKYKPDACIFVTDDVFYLLDEQEYFNHDNPSAYGDSIESRNINHIVTEVLSSDSITHGYI